MKAETNLIASYYDQNILGKLRDFAFGNMRLRAAIEFVDSCLTGDSFSLLDIGCGIGSFTNELFKRNPNGNFTGIDISPESIRVANKLFRNNSTQFHLIDNLKDMSNSVGKEKFDIISLIDVFEHLDEYDRTNLADFIKEHIQNDGRIIFTCPTPQHLDFLRQNYPDEIQPIDENISMEVLMKFSNQICIPLSYYALKSIRMPGDYFHAIFSHKQSPKLNRPVKIKPPTLTQKLEHRFKKIFFKHLPPASEENLAFISKHLGTKVADEIRQINDR